MALLTRSITVYEWERGLLYRRGRFARVLEPGRYRLSKRSSWVRKLDRSQTTNTVPGQEVLTGDGVTVRLSLAATYVVADPVRAVTAADDYRGALYLALQLALRDAVAALTIDELVETRSRIGAQLRAPAAERAGELGLELKQVELKDLMLTGELRRMMAQVVAARKEGQAALERARGETAASEPRQRGAAGRAEPGADADPAAAAARGHLRQHRRPRVPGGVDAAAARPTR